MLAGFGQTGPKVKIQKAISGEEFNDRYEAGYNVFDQDGIEKFKSDALEKGMKQEEIDSQLSILEPVLVQKGDETVKLFVSKIQEEGATVST